MTFIINKINECFMIYNLLKFIKTINKKYYFTSINFSNEKLILI